MQSDLGQSAPSHVQERSHSSALFFSDTHLLHHRNGGAHHHLKTLLSSSEKTIYAVGDILDLDAVDDALHWAMGPDGLECYPEDFREVLALIDFPHLEIHLRVLDTLIAKADAGAQVVYTPGNHDIGLDLLHGQEISGIKIRKNDVYEDGQGRKFLVEHGHLLDPGFLQNYQGWYRVGGRFLDAGLSIDHLIQSVTGFKGAFFASNLLKKIGKIYVNGFVDRAMSKARALGMDGIICGHIHKQAYMERLRYFWVGPMRNKGTTYINCGDGLTHGTYVSHKTRGPKAGWQLRDMRHIPHAANAILEETNFLAEYRGFTMAFLQHAWDAHLEHKARIAATPARITSADVSPVAQGALSSA